MKKTIFLFFFSCLFVFQTNACLNYYYSLDNEGHLHPLGDTWKFPFNKNFNLDINFNKLKALEKKLKQEKNYMLLSDYSVCLMKIGKIKEALIILAELYKHYPNEFQLASNLGTAYELNGKNDSALKYIKRGLQLNPHDHEGSEWIHVKILETKQKLITEPAYLNTHSVLELSEKQKKDSLVRNQLNIQLKERVPFSPGPDAIMASLFNDLGDLSANLRSIEYARAYYQIAKEYYGGKAEILTPKIKEMEKLISKYKTVQPTRDTINFGENEKIGYINYKELLKDNSIDYIIDLKEINTNTTELLAMADLSKTVEEAKHSVAKDTGELKLNKEDADITSPKPITKEWKNEPEEKNNLLFYIGGAALVILTFLFYKLKRKK